MLDRYHDLNRHWCPQSEPYTGCDSLLTAIDRGWKLAPTVTVHQTATCRIYVFGLYHQGKIATMKVIETPMLRLILQRYQLRLEGAITQPQQPYPAPLAVVL
ncbi:MAG: hypothetical protein CUN56_14025 [Phototrophicales bacterium]|nr:MAG: hypothetical protein CUN56_14025 [Phototrophicales bacterium]RMG72507.1 MAG: hypothetical protein D6711_12820 [Chloroflexota bacterium]